MNWHGDTKARGTDHVQRSCTAASARRVAHARRRWVVAIAAAVLTLAIGTSGADASVAWRVDSIANTVAVPGSTFAYFLQVQNRGDEDVAGLPVTFTAHLPAGMTAITAGGSGQGFAASDCHGSGGPADPVAGASTIVCETTNGFLTFLPAHGVVAPIVRVNVSPIATGTLTTTFEVSGGGAAEVGSTVDPTRVGVADPGFGIDAFDGQVMADTTGTPFTQAAGHPYAVSTAIDFNRVTNPNPFFGDGYPAEPVKDVFVDLPPGFVGNPGGLGKCSPGDLANASFSTELPLCSPASQVGVVRLVFDGGKVLEAAIYNMVAPPNVPARFGFNLAGDVIVLDAALRSGSDYGLSINSRNILEGLAVTGTSVTFWGVPADKSHDHERACPGVRGPYNTPLGPTCTTDAPRTAFLRNPTSCTAGEAGLVTGLRADSWIHPGVFKEASFTSHKPPAYPAPPSEWGAPIGPTNCDRVPFEASLKAAPVEPSRAGAPSGFTFDLSVPQGEAPEAIGQADLKKAVVTLPAGVRVAPASADGLGACSPSQIALHSEAQPTCPDSAKVGSLRIDTPLLESPLTGAVYLATPRDNPSQTLLGLYLVAKGPGVVVKLSGRVDTDPVTGQLTATFDDNPQLPFSKLHLEFKDGPRAPLVAPAHCGIYTTHAVMTGWNGKVATSDSSFTLDRNSKGEACSPLTFAPKFEAGSVSPIAGEHSSFVLRLSREDQDEELRSLTVSMPRGLLASVANVPLCPETQAALGTCGEGSRIGDVMTAAGAGPDPFWLPGRVYLGGPYKGAPFSLSIVVPAVAGPFNLGDVVVRTALYVDKATAGLRVVSDPFPTILEGIPLQVRAVRVTIDRKKFILNPTNCSVTQVRGLVGSTAGSTAHVSSRFQVGECASLSLKPKMELTIGGKGHTQPGKSTPLVTTLTQTPGQANLKNVTVTLPLALNALLPVVTDACTLAEFHAGHCEHARTGTAVATTPLLKHPVRGGAYFVKSPVVGSLPNLMVALRGQVDVDLTGRIVITPKTQQLSTSFDTIPDVPIKRFTLRLVAGKHGALGVVENLCKASTQRETAAVQFTGQNGRQLDRRQHLKVIGCPKPAHKAGHGR